MTHEVSVRRPAAAYPSTFVAARPDVRPRDQRDLMERPFFSLAKVRRVEPILYSSGNAQVRVYATSELGMATIWDADVLIWAISQIAAAEDLGLATSRRLRFAPFQLLRAIGRGVNQRSYQLLKAALNRLQSTVVTTSLRQDEDWQDRPFHLITGWEPLIDRQGRSDGIELELAPWLYAGAVDRSRLLAIDPAYFRLTGGLERWLYRVARKHAGRQPHGWSFELAHLHHKSGSQARLADFARALRRIIARQSLPGYRVHLAFTASQQLIEILPREAGDQPVDGRGTSTGITIGTSPNRQTAFRTHRSAASRRSEKANPTRNLVDSNLDSNSCGEPGRSGNPARGGQVTS